MRCAVADTATLVERQADNVDMHLWLQALLDMVGAAVISIGADGHIKEWNRGAEAISGLKKAEVIGLRVEVAGKIGKVLRALDSAATGRDEPPFWIGVRLPNGQPSEVVVKVSACRTGHREEGAVAIMMAGPPAHEGEPSRTSVDSIDSAVIAIDGNGHVSEWNKSAEILSGVPKHQIDGQSRPGCGRCLKP
jgi:PAS domain S-box-containing protein